MLLLDSRGLRTTLGSQFSFFTWVLGIKLRLLGNKKPLTDELIAGIPTSDTPACAEPKHFEKKIFFFKRFSFTLTPSALGLNGFVSKGQKARFQ